MELGLHLEQSGTPLRFYDLPRGRWLPTLAEARDTAEAAQQRAEAEVERLRQELATLRRGPGLDPTAAQRSDG